jgi:hypothetical protein
MYASQTFTGTLALVTPGTVRVYEDLSEGPLRSIEV